MKVLVTGATGLLGAHLVRTLVAAGYEVRALVRPFSSRDDLAGLPVEFVVGDVLECDDNLRRACAGCKLVFHAAAYFAYTGRSPAELSATAVEGTKNILSACAERKVDRVIVTSSSIVFGYASSPNAPIDEHAPVAIPADEPPYVAAKTEQHLAALSLSNSLGIEIVLACPTIILGSTNAALGPSNGIVASYLNDPTRSTFAGGCNLVGVEDVCNGHLILAERGKAGESYLLGGGNMTWRDIHSEISALAGLPGPHLELGHTLAYLAASFDELRSALAQRPPLSTRVQATMVGRYYWYSDEKARALGYAPKPAKEVLLETLSWLVTSRHISREIRATLKLSPDIFAFRRSQGAGVGKRRG
jgi:dihydroflavonol-4-reductase